MPALLVPTISSFYFYLVRQTFLLIFILIACFAFLKQPLKPTLTPIRLKILFQTASSKIKAGTLSTTQHLSQISNPPNHLTFPPLFALPPLDTAGF